MGWKTSPGPVSCRSAPFSEIQLLRAAQFTRALPEKIRARFPISPKLVSRHFGGIEFHFHSMRAKEGDDGGARQ